MEIKQYVLEKAQEAKQASRALLKVTSAQKDAALLDMAALIRAEADSLKRENRKDLDYGREKGLSPAMLNRLELTDQIIEEMAQGLTEVAAMTDPVGQILNMVKRPNGMSVGKMRSPIGSIGIIYESRPNVTADAAGLCLKAGNAVVLRGGSEAVHSNKAIVAILRKALEKEDIDPAAVTFIETTDREAINEMIRLEGVIDLIIPRGGEGLIRAVAENSRIPVLKHYKGVCHVYVDRAANVEMASDICFNSKVQRPGTCNAMETMLVDCRIAEKFLPVILKRFSDGGVKLKGCSKTEAIYPNVDKLKDEDLHNEYLELTLNVKVVETMDEAIEIIHTYGSGHTDAIVTDDYLRAMRFLHTVDSASVQINASTRLHDGGQFGLGAEIGISTDKIHSRGAMGLTDLTCLKYIVLGTGQIRE